MSAFGAGSRGKSYKLTKAYRDKPCTTRLFDTKSGEYLKRTVVKDGEDGKTYSEKGPRSQALTNRGLGEYLATHPHVHVDVHGLEKVRHDMGRAQEAQAHGAPPQERRDWLGEFAGKHWSTQNGSMDVLVTNDRYPRPRKVSKRRKAELLQKRLANVQQSVQQSQDAGSHAALGLAAQALRLCRDWEKSDERLDKKQRRQADRDDIERLEEELRKKEKQLEESMQERDKLNEQITAYYRESYGANEGKVLRSQTTCKHRYWMTTAMSRTSPSNQVYTDPYRPRQFQSLASNMGIVKGMTGMQGNARRFFDQRVAKDQEYWVCTERDPAKRTEIQGGKGGSKKLKWDQICKLWDDGEYAYMEQHDMGEHYEHNLLQTLSKEDLGPRPLEDVYPDSARNIFPCRLFLSMMKEEEALGNKTPWHQDKWAQVIVNVCGRKLWKVHPPIADKRFFARKEEVENFLDDGLTQTFELCPGDVFYLPAHWMHEVLTVGLSCTVNWGFQQRGGDMDETANKRPKLVPM